MICLPALSSPHPPSHRRVRLRAWRMPSSETSGLSGFELFEAPVHTCAEEFREVALALRSHFLAKMMVCKECNYGRDQIHGSCLSFDCQIFSPASSGSEG